MTILPLIFLAAAAARLFRAGKSSAARKSRDFR